MIKINENNFADAREIYNFIGVKSRFNDWFKNSIDFIGAKQGKDFYQKISKSSGGRPSIEYEISLDCAKELCLVQRTEKSKELRQWLISLSNKVENLELMTVKQAAFAVKVINCLKYIENQKEAKEIHKNSFVSKHIDITSPNYIYAEFEKYRSRIIGWDKKSVDESIQKYLNEHSGYNRARVDKTNMQTKLSIMDIGEAVRVACLDILYSKNADENIALNFSNLCKNLANEMKIQPEKKNETNLFHEKQALENVKNLTIENL